MPFAGCRWGVRDSWGLEMGEWVLEGIWVRRDGAWECALRKEMEF